MTDPQVLAIKQTVLSHLSSRKPKRPHTLFSEVVRDLSAERRCNETEVRAVVWMLVSEGQLRILPDRTLQKKRSACVTLE